MSKFSCVIPCYPPHFQYLERCFNQIKKQTLLPNEVILAISQTSDDEKNNLLKKYNDFFKELNIEFKIINSTKQQYAGINRNMGVSIATYEYIIFIDCDDYIHPEKFLITIKYMTKYNADVLIHSFVWNKPHEFIDELKIDIDNIKVIESEKIFNDNFPKDYIRNRRLELVGKVPLKIVSNNKNIVYHITAGYISCKKSVFDNLSYTSRARGQDSLFLRDCIHSKLNVIYLYAELLNYMH